MFPRATAFRTLSCLLAFYGFISAAPPTLAQQVIQTADGQTIVVSPDGVTQVAGEAIPGGEEVLVTPGTDSAQSGAENKPGDGAEAKPGDKATSDKETRSTAVIRPTKSDKPAEPIASEVTMEDSGMLHST